jgi:hypothetical protein
MLNPTLARLLSRARIFLACALLTFTGSHAWAQTQSPLSASVPPDSHAEILARAAAEKKPVLVLFSGTWDKESESHIAKTFADPRLQSWVTQNALTSAIDVLSSPELIRAHHIRVVPTILLLGSNGEELDRWTSLPKPSALLGDVQAALAGKSSTVKARAKLDADELKDHLELAHACDADGRYASALAQYLHVLGQLDERAAKGKMPPISGPRDSHIYRDMGKLAKRYPPAVDALRVRRAEQADTILAQPNRKGYRAHDVVTIDRQLDDTDATLAFFQQLPGDSKASRYIKPDAFEILIKRGAYRDAAALFTADELIALRGEHIEVPKAFAVAARMVAPIQAGEFLKSYRLHLMTKWSSYLEAYAATESRENTRTLARFILDHDKDDVAPALITAAANRALGPQADAFLRALEIPSLPAPPPAVAALPAVAPEPPELPEKDDPDLVELSPFVVSEKANGLLPLTGTWKRTLLAQRLNTPIKVRLVSPLIADKLQPGVRIHAIDGRAVTDFTEKELIQLWSTGDSGDTVTLIVQGQNQDDALYHEVRIARVSRAKLNAHPPKR